MVSRLKAGIALLGRCWIACLPNPFAVLAQTSGVLYRRPPACMRRGRAGGFLNVQSKVSLADRRTGSLRHGRPEICVTCRTFPGRATGSGPLTAAVGQAQQPRAFLASRTPGEGAGRGVRGGRGFRCAFTLLEVMIACGILFMSTFGILALVSNTLRNARSMRRPEVDAGMAAAQVSVILKTNRQADLSLSGDFGESFPDYSWEAESGEYATNGLLQVDIVVTRRGLREPVDKMSILVFAPDSKSKGPR